MLGRSQRLRPDTSTDLVRVVAGGFRRHRVTPRVRVVLGTVVSLDKLKRPGGTYWFEMRFLDQDEHGVWLPCLNGYRWRLRTSQA